MKPEEIKCSIILFILAGITLTLIFLINYIFIKYYPLNIYLILIGFACDVILSGYFIIKTGKIVKRKTKC